MRSALRFKYGFGLFVSLPLLLTCSGGATGPAAGPPTKYVVTARVASVVAGDTVTITAQLADSNGRSVAEASRIVTWSKTGAGGSFASATSTTNASGRARVVMTVGATIGTNYTVTATDGSALTGTSGTIVTTLSTAAFAVDINITRGTIRFPNKYSGWQVGGGSATNFVAYPAGWSVGGGSATNFIALPPGWTAGGGSATNYVPLAPGWTTGGGSATNYVSLPPGWTTGGGSATNYVPLPPGWSVGGGSATNYVPLPPGWTVGGGSATNYVTVPPGWTVGGGSATNYVSLASGWTTGGGSATNFVSLPPGWSVGGVSQTRFIAVPPGWLVGGGSATNFVAYPAANLAIIEIKFEDPAFLAMMLVLQQSGTLSATALADVVMAIFLNYGQSQW